MFFHETRCFKFKDRETKRKKGELLFSICSESNVQIFICNSYQSFSYLYLQSIIIYIFVSTNAFYFRHVSIFVPLRTSHVKSISCVLSVSVTVPVLSIYIPLLIWSFTFTEKSHCDKVDLVLSIKRIITIDVVLLVLWFISLSASLFVSWKDMHFFSILNIYTVT